MGSRGRHKHQAAETQSIRHAYDCCCWFNACPCPHTPLLQAVLSLRWESQPDVVPEGSGCHAEQAADAGHRHYHHQGMCGYELQQEGEPGVQGPGRVP